MNRVGFKATGVIGLALAIILPGWPWASLWPLSMLILLTVGLGFRSLLRRQQWMERAACLPLWRRLPHFLWWLLPTLLLAFYPDLVLWSSGRSFGYQELLRSLPDFSLWLGMCALLGAVNAGLRIRGLRRSGEAMVSDQERKESQSTNRLGRLDA